MRSWVVKAAAVAVHPPVDAATDDSAICEQVDFKTEVRQAIVSPNLADAVMMLRAPRYGIITINPALLAATGGNLIPLNVRR